MRRLNYFSKTTKCALLLLVLCSLFTPLVAQDFTYTDVTSEFLDLNPTQQSNDLRNPSKEEIDSNNSLQKEMPNLQGCTDSLNQLDLASMTASELCDNLIFQTETLLSQVEILTKQALTSQSLQESLAFELTITKKDLTKSMQDLQDVRTALASNREDTHNLIEVLAEAVEEVKKQAELVAIYEQRIKRGKIVSNCLIPSSFVTGVLTVAGIWCIVDGNLNNNETLNKTGWVMTGLGVGGFITIEVIWNIGSSPKIKLW